MNKKWTSAALLIGLMLTATFRSKSQSYCDGFAGVNTTCLYNGAILNVNFNTINNPSTCSGDSYSYANYTSITTTVNAGTAYAITVTMASASTTSTAAAWIDFNQNGTFESNEFFSLGTKESGASFDDHTFTGSILIPSSATAGNTRMRVRTRRGNGVFDYTNACTALPTSNRGEIEDYTVNIIVPVSSCDAPTALVATVADPNNASIHFTAPSPSPSDGYEYYLSTSSAAPGTTESGVTSGTSFSLSELTGSTTYYVWVRSVCGSSLKSIWSTMTSFSTPCTINALEYVVNFNEAPTAPLCWNSAHVTGTSSTNHISFVTSSSSPTATPFEGTGMAKFNSYSANNGVEQRLSSAPITSIGTSSVEISFQWFHSTLASYANDRMQVQYSLDGSTWNNAGTEFSRYHTTGGWSKKTITLPAAAAEQSQLYIGFLFKSANGYSMYIDAVNVKASPTCFPPESISFTNVSNNSVDIDWTPTTIAAEGYEYYLSTSSTAPTSSTMATGTSSSTNIHLESLTANTTYNIWLRAHCTAAEKSEWTTINTFTTLCNPGTLPFVEGFETAPSLPFCWSTAFVAGSTSTNYISITNSSTSPSASPYSGSGMVKFNAYSASSGIQQRLVSIPISTIGTESIDVSFQWYHNNAYSTYDDKVQVQYSIDGSGWFNAGTAISRYDSETGWEKYSITLPPEAGNISQLKIGLLFISAYGNNMYLDALHVDASPNCLPPTSLNITDITSSSAVLSWTASISESISNYDYIINTVNTPPTSITLISGTTTSNSQIFEGLESDTEYFVWVKTSCSDDEESSWSAVQQFRTACAIATVPFLENFESFAVSSLPTCFTFHNLNADSYKWELTDDVSYSGSNSISIASTYASNNDLFFINGLQLTAGMTYELNFKYRVPYSFSDLNNLSVYLSDNNASLTDAVFLYTHSNIAGSFGSTFSDASFTFSPTNTDVYYIGFLAENKAGIVIDDISINIISCETPSEVVLNSVNAHSAQVQWNATAASDYAYYVTTTNEIPSLSTLGIATTDTVIDLEDLNENTTYYFWTRSICSSSLKSEWSSVLEFQTSCGTPISLPTSNISVTQVQSADITLPYIDASCNILCNITSTEGDLGMVETSVNVEDAFFNAAGTPFMGRYYNISATNNNAAIVNLYYTDADIESYNLLIADNDDYSPITATSSNVKIHIYHSEPSGVLTGTDAYSPLEEDIEIVPASVAYDESTGIWTLTFSTSGFSGFFVNAYDENPLSVNILTFNAENNNTQNIIDWKISDLSKTTSLHLQKSDNGKDFYTVFEAQSANISDANQYIDNEIKESIHFYRLLLKQDNGKFEYSKTIQVKADIHQDLQITVFPNPSSHSITISSKNEKNPESTIQLMDVNGKTIAHFTKFKDVDLLINLNAHPSGIYYLHYEGAKNNSVIKVVKQ